MFIYCPTLRLTSLLQVVIRLRNIRRSISLFHILLLYLRLARLVGNTVPRIIRPGMSQIEIISLGQLNYEQAGGGEKIETNEETEFDGRGGLGESEILWIFFINGFLNMCFIKPGNSPNIKYSLIVCVFWHI